MPRPAFPSSKQDESDIGNMSVLADHPVQLDCRHNTANPKLGEPVFDPFSGASAASLAAQLFGLSGVGIGLHADHC
jgi:hypothetical protein